MSQPSAAQSFLALGRVLAERERLIDRLPLPAAERARAKRMVASARESLGEAMASVGTYLDQTSKLAGRS